MCVRRNTWLLMTVTLFYSASTSQTSPYMQHITGSSDSGLIREMNNGIQRIMLYYTHIPRVLLPPRTPYAGMSDRTRQSDNLSSWITRFNTLTRKRLPWISGTKTGRRLPIMPNKRARPGNSAALQWFKENIDKFSNTRDRYVCVWKYCVPNRSTI